MALGVANAPWFIFQKSEDGLTRDEGEMRGALNPQEGSGSNSRRNHFAAAARQQPVKERQQNSNIRQALRYKRSRFVAFIAAAAK